MKKDQVVEQRLLPAIQQPFFFFSFHSNCSSSSFLPFSFASTSN